MLHSKANAIEQALSLYNWGGGGGFIQSPGVPVTEFVFVEVNSGGICSTYSLCQGFERERRVNWSQISQI